MRYPLISTKMRPAEILLLAGGFILINILVLPLLSTFLILLDIAILAGILYRIHEYLYTAYPASLETAPDGLVISYDRGFERRIGYSYIKEALAVPFEDKPYDRIIVLLNSAEPLKGENRRISHLIAADHDTALRIVDDIKAKAAAASKPAEAPATPENRPPSPPKKRPAPRAGGARRASRPAGRSRKRASS